MITAPPPERTIAGMPQRQAFRFCLDQCHSDWLRAWIELHVQKVIDTPSGAAARSAINDLDCPSAFFTADEVFRPTARVQGRVDQFSAGVGFIECHVNPII